MRTDKKSLKKIICAVLLFAVIIAVPLKAEADEPEADALGLIRANSGYSSVLYDNTNGLPTSEANAIAQTQDGFIWIGSYGGLIRHDGNTFERITPALGISSVVDLYVDSKNRLWIGTNDSGVCVMDGGETRVYNRSSGLRSLYVRSVVEEHNGNIYIATAQGLGVIGGDMEFRLIDEPQINNEYIYELRVGPDDVIYGRTNNGAVFTLKDGKLLGFYDGVSAGITGIHCIVPDNNAPGYVYIGTMQSDVYYGKLDDGLRNLTRISIEPLEYVNDIFQIENQVWLCTDAGVGIIENGVLTNLNELPLNNSVECMLMDYQGNLWFASSKQGVMKIVPNQFADIFEQYGIKSCVVNTTCVYENYLLVGRKSEGLIAISKDGVTESIPIKEAKTASGEAIDADDLVTLTKGCQIRSIVRDSKNRLWISEYGKYSVICYDNGVVTCFSIDDGMPSERARTVVERSDGSMMVACTGGLVIIKDGRVTDVYDESSSISNTEVLTVAESFNGDMLVGTDGSGIYVISSGNRVTHFGIDSGLASEVVLKIKKDVSRDIIWIVTSNSIAFSDADYNISTVERFPYSNNFDIYENSYGDVWVLSSNGIYVASAGDLLANKYIPAVLYSRHDGLPCITTANSYSELTSSGDLYISGTTGVARVNIEKPFENVENIKTSVPYVEADGELIYPDKNGTITIPSRTKKLTIYSYVLTYSLTNPQVAYRLEGFDSEDTIIRRNELGPVDYTNLRGGNYRFVMSLADGLGNDGGKTSVLIVKQKAIYEEVWFMILAGLLAVALIVFAVRMFYRRKTKLLMEKDLEQREFIREVTEVLAKTIDMKDKYTNGHSMRVAKYTAMLTKELGYDEETVDKYYNIALLHDIGKISVPEEVLNKNGKLNDEEFDIIKSHAKLGGDALRGIIIMPELAVGAECHHERPDGKGYPKGLKGDEIPRVAQIIAVADCFDAMYSDRPYRKRMNFDKAVSIIKEVSGTQLTPDVVDAFLRLVDKGEMRDKNDTGGGTTDDIDNIRSKFEAQAPSEKSAPPENEKQ